MNATYCIGLDNNGEFKYITHSFKPSNFRYKPFVERSAQRTLKEVRENTNSKHK